MDRSRRLDDVDVLDSNLVKFRGLYSFHDTEESQFKSKKQNIHDFGSSALYKDVDNESITSQNSPRLSERPVTPINDSIKSAPKTYATLSKLIHRRIHPRPEWDHISVEDQSSLGAVIMGEVNTVWPLLRNQLDDPFLNRHQNRELQRRITVHCVTVCEHLFLHYSEKVKTLNNKGIFTNSANMCRVRGQLAVDAGKYLNILSVRRHIVADLKKPPMKEQITYSREEASRSPSTPGPPQRPRQLSFRKLIKSSRPRRKLKYQFNLRAEIQEMQSVMPSISLSKIESLMNKSYTFLPSRPKDLEIEDDDNTDSESLDMKTDVGKSSPDFERSQIHRCPSEPSLPHTLLLDEILQIEKEEEDYLLMRSPSMAQESSLDLPPNTPMPVREVEKVRCHTSQGLRTGPKSDTKVLESSPIIHDKVEKEVAKENLSTLDYMSELQTDAGDEELPPLIQAITRRQRQDAKLRELKKKEIELDKKRDAELEERMKPLPQAQYPQPPIVQSKLPGVSNPMTRKPITIRASDVKINDHVDLSSVSLKLYQPVYNDLKGDISPATVKELDANLFQGGELKEVYFEIMKTVPNIHQRYDNDPLIVSPASNVDLSKILASSTLARPRSQQVINPNLIKDYLDMPWNGQQLNIPKPTYQPYAGYPSSEATSVSHVQEEISAFHRFTPSQLQHPGVDKGSRAYASWLQWWKSTVNSDDFFKYLSTQDTDFLSVIFHFYDSEYDDSELESVGTDKLEAERERERKLAELKKEKEEFIPGLWNVKSVILGGLGKDPVIEEDEHEISEMVTPLSTSRSQRMSQSPARTLSRTPRNSTPRHDSYFKSKMAVPPLVPPIKFRKIEAGRNSAVTPHKTVLEPSAIAGYSPRAASVGTDSITGTGTKDSTYIYSDSEFDDSKSDVKDSFNSEPTANSARLKYFPNRANPSLLPIQPQCKDGGSILKIVQSRNLQNAILEGYAQSKSSCKSESGEQSHASTSGYHSANSEVVRHGREHVRNDESCSSSRDAYNEPACLSEKLRAKWKNIRERSVFSANVPVDTKSFLSSSDHCTRIERIIAENKMLNRSRSSPRGTTFSSKPKSNTTDYTHRKQQESPRELTVQERLEIIWEKLKMPDSQKLDSALKYSTDEYIKLLPEITLSWEQVTDAILKREKIMANLEIFEKEASDPNRFFEKGEKGSSVARLTEAKTRASLYKKLEMVDASVRELLASIKKRFSDVVTFNGRPYHEKMDWDRVEMLYFLQQERRCLMLQAHGHPESLDAFVSHGQVRPRAILPPITKTFTQIPINSVRLTVPE